MSIRRGNKIIASRISNGFSLFDCKWADHILNNISWLRADTFSWQSGDVYKAAYEHLDEDLEIISWIESIYLTYYRTPSDDVVINGTQYYAWTLSTSGDVVMLTTSATPQSGDAVYNQDGTGSYGGVDRVGTYIKGAQTETIGDITIKYYLAEDGHKICLPDQESNLVALYEATGVAWYYILDTENKQFKLPRTKFGFTGIRNGVGGYVAPGLPNITGEVQVYWETDTTPSGAFYKTSNKYSERNNANGHPNLGFDASRSNSIYGNSTTVQPPATQMYLYFYVGNYIEDLATIDAGKLAEVVNDADFVVAFQKPTSANGYTWYRKYKSGWVEQGGSYEMTIGTANAQFSISLPVEMANVRYTASVNVQGGWATENVAQIEGNTTTVLNGYAKSSNSSTKYILWQVSGMFAQ